MKQTLIAKIANTIDAYKRCIETSNDYSSIHLDTIKTIERDYLLRGSGIDSGCTINIEKSSADKVVIETSFHHMDANGYYDGWTQHSIIITPSFYGFHVKVTGKDKNMIKDYLADEFNDCLSKIVDMSSH